MKVVRLSLRKERTVFDPGRPLHETDTAMALFKGLLASADREAVWAVAVDAGHWPLAANLVALGSVEATPVHPREIFKFALLANASKVVIGHNHLSQGPALPSDEDRELTKRIAKAGQLLRVPLLDHIIVAPGGSYSFAQAGLLAQFRSGIMRDKELF